MSRAYRAVYNDVSISELQGVSYHGIRMLPSEHAPVPHLHSAGRPCTQLTYPRGKRLSCTTRHHFYIHKVSALLVIYSAVVAGTTSTLCSNTNTVS